MNPIDRRLVDDGLLPHIFRAAEAAHPSRACGFVFDDGTSLVHIPTQNHAAADSSDEGEPGATAVEPDMKPWLRAQQRGLVPVIIYRSTLDAEPLLTERESESALLRIDETLVLERNPGVEQLVVSLCDGRTTGAALYRFDHGTSEFQRTTGFDADGQLT